MKQNSGSLIKRILTIYIAVVLSAVTGIIAWLIHLEVKTSKYQAQYLSQISKQLSFKLVPGASSSVRYPQFGPYDQRLGYILLPDAIERLKKAGYGISAQADFSPMMAELVDYGLFTVYHEKTQAGLRILDRRNQLVFKAVYPAYGYPNFEAVPPVILNTLLFIENRELLNEQNNQVNPAIEWDRLGFASLQLMAHKLGATSSVPGGSTLATQIEKYRHSPNGYTNSISDKFRQMGTASVRAYLMGPDTRAMRQEIALSYLNSMPLSATPKSGEIHGLGDGLAAWFGADFNEINKLLDPKALATTRVSKQQAQAYRQVLGILLSQRRPTYLLGRGFDTLQNLTDSHLRLLAEKGLISNALRDAALREATLRPSKSGTIPAKFAVEKKTQAVLRSRLGRILNVKSNYDLDRLDLTVKTTLDFNTQQAINQELRRLGEPENAKAAGLLGKRMLSENSKLAPIIYSLMLFERGKTGNLLRVQTDNYDQALDINEGIRIDLGSTAKLRTMVHYLELITDIYERYKNKSADVLKPIPLHPRDYFSQWVIEQLTADPQINLETLLNKALDRRYSASPGESFFTGGGLHTFSNFTKDENYRIMSVREALRDSVNLVFVRLMRDIVYHHLYKPDGLARWLESPDDPRRKKYLQRFADREGSVYLQRFYAKYKDKTPDEAFAMLSGRVFAKPSRLTMLFRAVYPDADEQALKKFLQARLHDSQLSDDDIYDFYDKYTVGHFDLQDQGYITKIHPLELWLVNYLVQHPKAGRDEVMEASAKQRQDVYRWLFKSGRKNAQQRRIMTLLEIEAFRAIHKAWQQVGYPFEELTPSYATSIGASGDRPAALAELMGILRNDGKKLPMVRFESLHFAQGTPYETVLNKSQNEGQQLFASEIAKVARGALSGVVEGGTASRLKGVYTNAAGSPLSVGGKTGTGDHRKEIWGPGGRLIESKFISRAAVFTFFIGERFFGVITAYVTGEDAGSYHFTSSLPVQILRHLKPTLSPLINTAPENEGLKPASEAVAPTMAKHVKTKMAVPASLSTESVKPIRKTPKPKLVKIPVIVANPKPVTGAFKPAPKPLASKPRTIKTPTHTPVLPATGLSTKPAIANPKAIKIQPTIPATSKPIVKPLPKPTQSQPIKLPAIVPNRQTANPLPKPVKPQTTAPPIIRPLPKPAKPLVSTPVPVQ
ncbi:transglycosylase domain-containing protein [Methylovulum sp.]|uniref:transglycosylase domain-containing protein n=1 Tax=Methylovulum sp. TaxID=1916980 RepID=UPI0026111DFE|nr:transglycosylase domain-containing protein [Methylovulum sp.]MDD5125192.1 transglycosylase domain-containing protein [Methylovulum sp.]